jgi:hypothetical protein
MAILTSVLLAAGSPGDGTTDPAPPGATVGMESALSATGPQASGTSTSPQASGTSTSGQGAAKPSVNPLGSLPLIPWEGGPAYWSKFSNASGWTDPSFFPIMIDNSFSTEAEVRWDKSHGITAYSGGWPDTVDYQWLKNNHMYWLDGRPNNTFPAATASSPYWPGVFIADEPDGQRGAQGDLDYVRNLVNSHPEGAGRFQEINFTQIVAGNYDDRYTQMMNLVNGPISADMYWYTTLNCGPGNPGYDNLAYPPVDKAHCRTSSSYGKLAKSLWSHDTGQRQPIWVYIEDLNGGPGGQPFSANITGGQLKGAVMDSIINEARGIIYFNVSLTGPCQESLILRVVQTNGSSCAASQIKAMGEVDNQVLRLAPIINTQSYKYTFGPKLDTTLKWYNGSAYIFAMINGDADSFAGSRTFTLPPALASATSVSVVDEGRTIPVSGGTFTDNFAAEYTYHIYQVTP